MNLDDLQRELIKVRTEYLYLQATEPDDIENLKFLKARIEAIERAITKQKNEL